MMAFSIAWSCVASQGWIRSVRASGTETEAIWFTMVGVP